jgi:hypothetical protein
MLNRPGTFSLLVKWSRRRPGLAEGLGDRRGAAFGRGVLGAGDSVQDRPDLGQQLGEQSGGY